MKAADSLIIFLDSGARSTVVPSKTLYRCEKCVLQTFELQDYNWPNHKINGYSGSRKSLIQADDGQNSELVNVDSFQPELLCLAESAWRQYAILSLPTRVYIDIKLKFRHSRGMISN